VLSLYYAFERRAVLGDKAREDVVAIQGDALKKGWGVVRLKPWHLAGIFVSSADAENLAQQLGEAYVVKYGDHAFGSPDFKFSDNEPI